MPRRATLCPIFALLWLLGCAGEPVKHQASQRTPSPRQAPDKAIRQKPEAEAIKSYGLADTQASQHLLTADTLLQAGDSAGALKQLDLIDEAGLSPEQRSKFHLLAAQMALSMGDAEQALQKLENVRPRLLAETDKVAYYQSMAFAQALQGDVLQAVSARLHLGNLLKQPEQQQANIAAILDMLSVVPPETLNAPPEMTEELGGWLALAKLLKQRDSSAGDINAQIQQWRQTFPNHPANAEFLQAYLTQVPAGVAEAVNPPATAQAADKGPFIAVLLPGSGAYASAGKAIRQGLLAAQRVAAAASSSSLPLKFYDTEQGDVAGLYQQALTEGAKQVIGPLIKEQIQALAAHTELTVPLLALNQVDNLSKANLYQFGLNPQDEAEQLAIKARRDGRQSAVVLVPNNSQGQRIGHYLASRWQSEGGVLSGMQSYDPKQHDIGTMLSGLIAKPDALQGQQQPPQTLLLSASPEVARELAPQLKYYQSSDLAVYAMPNVYSGHQDPNQDAELGRIHFCDMPWLLNAADTGPLSQSALQTVWQDLPESATRLVAMGIDAYNLLGQLSQLASVPYQGATGTLTMNGENRISRKLVCAEFKGGVPVVAGYPE